MTPKKIERANIKGAALPMLDAFDYHAAGQTSKSASLTQGIKHRENTVVSMRTGVHFVASSAWGQSSDFLSAGNSHAKVELLLLAKEAIGPLPTKSRTIGAGPAFYSRET